MNIYVEKKPFITLKFNFVFIHNEIQYLVCTRIIIVNHGRKTAEMSYVYYHL